MAQFYQRVSTRLTTRIGHHGLSHLLKAYQWHTCTEKLPLLQLGHRTKLENPDDRLTYHITQYRYVVSHVL